MGSPLERLTVNFQQPPTAGFRDLNGERRDIDIHWGNQASERSFPATREIHLGKLMGQESFQALCNKQNTPKPLRRN